MSHADKRPMPSEAFMNGLWGDSKDAAAYAGMAERVVARLARLKKIPAGNDGRHWRFKKEQVDRFLLSRGNGR